MIPSVAYTDPEVAWMGVTKNEAKGRRRQVPQRSVPMGRVLPVATLGRDEGITKVLFDESIDRDHRGAALSARMPGTSSPRPRSPSRWVPTPG